jgi:hypothetical protein
MSTFRLDWADWREIWWLLPKSSWLELHDINETVHCVLYTGGGQGGSGPGYRDRGLDMIVLIVGPARHLARHYKKNDFIPKMEIWAQKCDFSLHI